MVINHVLDYLPHIAFRSSFLSDEIANVIW